MSLLTQHLRRLPFASWLDPIKAASCTFPAILLTAPIMSKMTKPWLQSRRSKKPSAKKTSAALSWSRGTPCFLIAALGTARPMHQSRHVDERFRHGGSVTTWSANAPVRLLLLRGSWCHAWSAHAGVDVSDTVARDCCKLRNQLSLNNADADHPDYRNSRSGTLRP